MKNKRKRYTLIDAVIEAIGNPPETVAYPHAALELSEHYRGALIFDPEKCIGCSLCVRDCPAEALEMDKESRDIYILIHYPARCAYCGQCVDSCRHGAISLSNQLVGSTTDKMHAVLVLKDTRE